MNNELTKLITIFQKLIAKLRMVRTPILESMGLLGSQMMIISALYRFGKPISRIELSDLVGLSTTALGRPIDQLVDMKYIQRKQDENNRRYIQLTLTEKGIEIAKQYRKKMLDCWSNAARDIPQKDFSTFLEVMEKIADQMAD